MLVEFSPWETTDTSLRLSASKRKRPRGGLSSSSSVCQDEFPIAGSIITTKIGRRKQRNSPDSSRAVVAITSPYRVSVLVSKNHGSATGAPKTEALDAADSLHESARLQYSCRPGKSSCFLPEKAGAKIPVVFDSKNDRFWALQNGNQRLVVWDAQSEGPDDNGAAKGVQDLKEPAVSLTVLPSGLVVGSTASGSIYYASVEKEISSIQVSYISLPDLKDKKPKSMDHAGTFLSVREPATKSTSSGSKRKSSKGGSEHVTIELYQVFVSGTTATIMSHDLAASGDHNLEMERRKFRVASFSICPLDESSSSDVQDATVVRTTIGNPDSALLYYRLDSKNYCCSIQLQSARLAHPPFQVAEGCGPQRLALIAPKILAMGVGDKILLCDALNGVVIHREPLPFTLEEDAEDYVLVSDPRKGLLVALFRNGEKLNATTTTLQLEDATDPSYASSATPFQTSLAARLSASLNVSSQTNKLSKRITLLEQPGVEEVKTVDMQFGGAVEVIEESSSLIFQTKGDGYKQGSLVDAFKSSVARLHHSPIVLKKCATCDMFQSSPDSPTSTGERKDSKGATTPTKDPIERINGSHRALESPPLAHVGKTLDYATPEFDSSTEVTPSDNEEQINGLHHAKVNRKLNDTKTAPSNKRDATRTGGTGGTSNPERLPLSFVDAVTPIIVRLLRHFGSLKAPYAGAIKEDCCKVLRSLLASGNVSVRKHFDNNTDVVEEGTDFGSLLLCMGCKQTKDNRLSSPMDVMLDMLRYCEDVSESQLVTMMHFMLCRSRPVDIAFAFLDFASLPAEHPNKELISRYMKYVEQSASKADPSLIEKIEQTENELVVTGSGAVLELILKYSKCNQALLVAALRETFSVEEARLLCGLLSDLAFTGSPSLSAGTPTDVESGGKVKSAVRWIPALFGAFSDLADESGMVILDHLAKAVNMARLQTEVLIQLEDDTRKASARIISEEEGEKELTYKQKKRKRLAEEDALPPYSLERLSF